MNYHLGFLTRLCKGDMNHPWGYRPQLDWKNRQDYARPEWMNYVTCNLEEVPVRNAFVADTESFQVEGAPGPNVLAIRKYREEKKPRENRKSEGRSRSRSRDRS